MSGSNFVHGIVLVGTMITLAHAETRDYGAGHRLRWRRALAGNATGGRVVTERMLEMFKSSKDKKD